MKHLTRKELEIAMDNIKRIESTINWQKDEIRKYDTHLKMLKGALKQKKNLLSIAMFVVESDDKEME